jgi:hypothetical protein
VSGAKVRSPKWVNAQHSIGRQIQVHLQLSRVTVLQFRYLQVQGFFEHSRSLGMAPLSRLPPERHHNLLLSLLSAVSSGFARGQTLARLVQFGDRRLFTEDEDKVTEYPVLLKADPLLVSLLPRIGAQSS